MSSMFHETKNFNQNINNWDISKVKNISSMFNRTERFNQPLNNWNTSKVTYMSLMFRSAKSFNQDISNWDLNSIKDKKASCDFQFSVLQLNYRPKMCK